MQRGINLGNALDALPGAVDTLQIRDRHLDAIRAAGFDTVRLPVRWSAHTAPVSSFSVDPAFLDAVDQMVDRLLERGFDVVVDDHHDDELCADPASHTDRFLAMWEQIAERLARHTPAVHVELLNEPRLPMTPLQWNRLLAAALGVVRDVDHDRTVIIGPAAMNTIDALGDLELPVDDRLILTIHYYEPLAFTHQGAPWWPGADRWLDTAWGSDTDRHAVDADLQRVAAWADERRLLVFISEFGTYRRAAMPARVSWTTVVRTTAERLGMSWCYWDFATDFGAYDTITDSWRPELRAALLTPDAHTDHIAASTSATASISCPIGCRPISVRNNPVDTALGIWARSVSSAHLGAHVLEDGTLRARISDWPVRTSRDLQLSSTRREPRRCIIEPARAHRRGCTRLP